MRLRPPAFTSSKDAFAQVKYLEDYLRRTDITGSAERTVMIEERYIDRDFMADHSVLFASTLRPPPNHCRRLHFFAGTPEEIYGELLAIAGLLSSAKSPDDPEYDRACEEFSDRSYLGFSVIRPLGGCPVGRTVVRLLPGVKESDNSIRVMSCTRLYRAHFLGVRLFVRGLAFQQQDLGVSRCSTIALWCALHKAGESEHLTNATPAEITRRASQYRLPFGRPMPSEGLAVDQMCLALQSLGMPPFLAKVSNFAQGRSLIFSATLSAMPCILVMQLAEKPGLWHAVTVAGMKLRDSHETCLVNENDTASGDDDSGDLKALYVQDDRVGPYLRAEVFRSGEQFWVSLNVEGHAPDGAIQQWIVHHVVLPLHSKIRISFNDLRNMSSKWIIPAIQRVLASGVGTGAYDRLRPIRFRFWMERGHRYVQRVLSERLLSPEEALRFRAVCMLPRYIAVIRFFSPSFGQLDVLVDTTTPKPNYLWIGLLARREDSDQGKFRHLIAGHVAARCRCEYFH